MITSLHGLVTDTWYDRSLFSGSSPLGIRSAPPAKVKSAGVDPGPVLVIVYPTGHILSGNHIPIVETAGIVVLGSFWFMIAMARSFMVATAAGLEVDVNGKVNVLMPIGPDESCTYLRSSLIVSGPPPAPAPIVYDTVGDVSEPQALV